MFNNLTYWIVLSFKHTWHDRELPEGIIIVLPTAHSQILIKKSFAEEKRENLVSIKMFG